MWVTIELEDDPLIYFYSQYAQRAVMKSIRFIKLRTFCKDPADLTLMRNINPLKRFVSMTPSRQTTPDFLNAFKISVDFSIPNDEP